MPSGPLNVLAVLGSSRSESISARLAQAVLDEAHRRGAAVRTCDLREVSLPHYDPSDAANSRVRSVRSLVRWADAYVLGTPDYHGGPSGRLKNFLDHFWHEFTGKLFATVVASHEKGLTVQDQLRTAIRQCYGWSLPYGVSASPAQVDEDGGPDQETSERLRMMGRDLVVYGALLRRQRLADQVAAGEDRGFIGRPLE